MVKKFYLAHNFGSRFKVRDSIMSMLQGLYPEWEIVNPFMVKDRYNEGLYEYGGTSEKELNERFMDNIDTRSVEIVENDFKQIDNCDMLVAYIERPSVGTSMEILYAKLIKKIKVVLVFDTDVDLYYHPWLVYFSDERMLLDDLDLYPLTNGIKIDMKVLEAFQKYGNEIAYLLAVKNVAYGRSASNLSYNGVNKRINEKTMRIANLTAKGMDSNDGESVRETIIDMGGYSVIELMCHDKAFPFEDGFTPQSLLDAFDDNELVEEMKKRGLMK